MRVARSPISIKQQREEAKPLLKSSPAELDQLLESLREDEEELDNCIENLEETIHRYKWSLISEFSNTHDCAEQVVYKEVIKKISEAVKFTYKEIMGHVKNGPNLFKKILVQKVLIMGNSGFDTMRRIEKVFRELKENSKLILKF